VGVSDSSFGDAMKCRSTSTYLISWSSGKQPITAMSTTEAEYVAAAEAAKHAVWIRHFLFAIWKKPTNLTFKEPTQLGINNQGALALASNPVNHPRSKNIHVRYPRLY
jgi:hypothetical protein